MAGCRGPPRRPAADLTQLAVEGQLAAPCFSQLEDIRGDSEGVEEDVSTGGARCGGGQARGAGHPLAGPSDGVVGMDGQARRSPALGADHAVMFSGSLQTMNKKKAVDHSNLDLEDGPR